MVLPDSKSGTEPPTVCPGWAARADTGHGEHVVEIAEWWWWGDQRPPACDSASATCRRYIQWHKEGHLLPGAKSHTKLLSQSSCSQLGHSQGLCTSWALEQGDIPLRTLGNLSAGWRHSGGQSPEGQHCWPGGG